MTMEERITDISQRLTRELSNVRTQLSEQRAALSAEFAEERVRLNSELEECQGQLMQRRLMIDQASARMRIMTTVEEDDDILTLNVGGTLFTTRRSTLCLCEGCYLANLFSGRWDDSIEKDSEGRFFLDFDPGSFRLALDFLRSIRLEHSSAPIQPPDVPPERQEHFWNLVEYLGLTARFTEGANDRSEVKTTVPLPQSGLGSGLLGSATAFFGAMVGTQSSSEEVSRGSTSQRLPEVPSARTQHGPPASSSRDLHGAGVLPTSRSAVRMTPLRPVGWSTKVTHPAATADPEKPMTVSIADTRSLASAAAVRTTRGFRSGTHSWKIHVDVCSDWSYVGLVGENWTAVNQPIGRSALSWGVASNGAVYACRSEVGQAAPYSFKSCLVFTVTLSEESPTVSVVIDGKEFRNLFENSALPEVVYPAVSNCRSFARYAFEMGGGVDQDGLRYH